jgi:hypothetical protein
MTKKPKTMLATNLLYKRDGEKRFLFVYFISFHHLNGLMSFCWAKYRLHMPLVTFTKTYNDNNSVTKLVMHVVATLLWECVRMRLTLPKWGLGSPSELLKLQSLIAKVKTPRLEVFFISLQSCRSVDVENGLTWAIWTSIAQVMDKKRAGSQTGNLTPDQKKSGIDPPPPAPPGVCRESATHRWKDLKESYKFALDFIPIGGLSKELWPHKVSGVQTGTISGLHFGSPGTKSHLGVGAME